ncbi:MAG TPA: undecaprenyl/decaprenyl-phosphate alpha-N-acetylglucosaminyl 1-phosphate transferase [Streptosporangiaceae bacterium]|nr:undecaprenyl/decaprenyl-phosphate alpha-N-acetylglucosaminyl 1-phosphate transferase [Streptosporangiaceae bacterium]
MREYGLTLLVTAAVTYLLTPLVRRAAVTFGALLPARDRDVHAAPTPRMGGLAMYLGVAAGLIAARSMVPLRTTFSGTGLIVGLLGAGGLIVLVGIIDDRWGISALGKLVGQVAAAYVLFQSGAQLGSFPEPQNHLFVLTHNEQIVLTILVVVATINAVNFIDGLDGLAAGIVCIAAMSFFVYYYSLAKHFGLSAEAVPALASIVLAGVCLGFLPHNFFPAKIFMGDTGSMLLGLMLAYVPIWAINSLDYESLSLQSKVNRFPEILPLLLPAAVMVIPYVDLLRAVVRRTRAGQSPFAPDNKHLHHRLLEIGHSHRSSVLILYAWAALFAGTVVGLSILTTPLIVLAGTTLAAVLVLALLSMPRLRWWKRAQVPRPAVTVPARAGHTVPGPAGNGQVAADPVAYDRVAPGPAGNGQHGPGPYYQAMPDPAWPGPDPAWPGPDPARPGPDPGQHGPTALASGQPEQSDATAPMPLPAARASGTIVP